MFKIQKNICIGLLVILVIFAFSFSIYAFSEDAETKDVANSSDHPLISRFDGSYIRFFQQRNYDKYILPFSNLEEPGDNEDIPIDDKRVEGEVYQYFYVIPDGHSVLEVFRNYEMALEEAGFETIRKQEGDISHNLSSQLYSKVNWDSCPGNRFNGVGVDHDTGDQSYLAAKLERPEGDVYLSLYIADHGIDGGNWGEERPAVYQVVVEEKDMETGLVNANSDFEKEAEKEQDLFPADAETKDVPDSSDHPVISRFKGSYLRFYDHNKYDEFTLPFSKLKDSEEDMGIEGEITKNFYVIPDGHSVLEVFRNYELALEEAGFETIRKQTRDISYNLSRKLYSKINWETCPGNRFNGVGVHHDTGDQSYLAAKLERSEGDLYLSLYVADHGIDGGNWGEERPAVYQVVVEEKEMETGLVKAGTIIQDIESKGKVSIYGVYFDTDSAEIKSESDPTVEEIAKVLNDNPELNIYIVGHTDSTGEFDYNIELSEKRAEALVNKLVQDYDIDKSRLEPAGVGPLAPKASNETEDGRAKNRRVELVKM
ncbi:MAG: OmpA family protein [Halanaerobiales bacterium]